MILGLILGALWTGTTPAQAYPSMMLPFAAGQTWYVCQGYNGGISHSGQPWLDVTTYPGRGSDGCWGGANAAAGGQIVAPADGTTTNWDAAHGGVCVTFDGGGSLIVYHLINRVGNGRVARGQQIGTVAPAGQVNNGGYAHAHLEMHSGGCGSAMVSFSGGARFECAPDMPYSGQVNQWAGQALTRNCGSGQLTDGTFVSYNGDVFRIAGGAPVYVSSWDHVGGDPGNVRALSTAEFQALRTYPADGTLIVGLAPGDPDHGSVYRVAGGAPVYVSNWDHIGGNPGTTVGVDLFAIKNAGGGGVLDHLRQRPADGTLIVGLAPGDPDHGSVYRVAGGAPIYVSNWDHIGGNPGTTVGVDLFAIKNAGGGGVLNHLLYRPVDGTYLNAAQKTYRVEKGAPILQSAFHEGVVVDPVAIANAGKPGVWSHLAAPPAQVPITAPGDSPAAQLRVQTLGDTRKKMRKGRRIQLPSATSQGAAVTWKARPKRVCRVSGHTLRAKRKGKCVLRASAPALPGFYGYAATFRLKVR